MGVKYLQRADTGATVDPGAIDYQSILNQSNQQAQNTNAINLLQVLASLNSQGQSGAVSPLDVMSANSQMAAQQAQGYSPSATYLAGLDPGGLYDYMSNFMGQLGFGPGPSLDMGDRLVNRVAVPSMADAVAQAQAINQQMGYQPQAGAGKYDSVIQQIIAPIIASLTGNSSTSTADTAKPATPGPTGFDTKPQNTGVALPNGAIANMPPSPDEARAMATALANERANNMGGGVNDLINLLLGAGGSAGNAILQGPNTLIHGLSSLHPGY